MTGVEGYVESNASGFLAGVALACALKGKPAPDFTAETAIGALGCYVSNQTVTKFQPMNINFGILDPLGRKVRGKREKNLAISARAMARIDSMKGELL
jgi:methylenetetrahydrofolate--tRNA-(uracil-5-)-methyltransferase